MNTVYYKQDFIDQDQDFINQIISLVRVINLTIATSFFVIHFTKYIPKDLFL